MFKYNLFQKGIVRDCITMCFDICTINICVSIRVGGFHIVFVIKSCQIIENNLISQQKKMKRGQAVTKFKPTEQGHVYTLQTSTYQILQTNPLPLQISNGENMKFLWVTKLKLIENQKGLALQRWISLIIFPIFTSGSKTSLYKARIHLCWRKKNK